MDKRNMAYKTAYPDRYEILKAFARENRKNATLAENILWEHIRDNALGVKFLRQHVIGDYIADFLSRKGNLIIEVDGGYHAERQQQEDDIRREHDLVRMGYHIIRISNEEVLYDIKNVIQRISNHLNQVL